MTTNLFQAAGLKKLKSLESGHSHGVVPGAAGGPQSRRLVLRETGQIERGTQSVAQRGQKAQRGGIGPEVLQAPHHLAVAGLTESVKKLKQCLGPLGREIGRASCRERV